MGPEDQEAQDPLLEKSRVARLGLAALVLALLANYGFFVAVPERTAAVITRFGRPVRTQLESGPAWRWPWPIEQIRILDMRGRIFDTPYTTTFTRDKKTLVLLTYVLWKVQDPLRFLQAVGGRREAERKLGGMVTAAKNSELGRYDLENLVSTDPTRLRTEQIEAAILEAVRPTARDKLGVELIQVGFQRVAYPAENTPAVLEYMRSERKAVAARLRAEGERDASRLVDEAVVETERILATGRTEAGRILGEAEREAAKIYSEAHRKDPDFYRFWRSLEATEKALSKRSRVILRTDQGFFGALEEAPSGAERGGAER